MTQVEYIALLFNDCGFDMVKSRAAFMTREFGRPVKFSDELQSWERSKLIDVLKDIKAGQYEKSRANWREDEE